MRAVSIVDAPPRAPWGVRHTSAGEPVYVTDDGRMLVQLLETTDGAGRRWRHVLAFLPVDFTDNPRDLARAFFGDETPVHVEDAIVTPGGSHALVRLHRCIDAAIAGPPPPPTQRRRARRTPAARPVRASHLKLLPSPASA
jgi:hypothetical protein